MRDSMIAAMLVAEFVVASAAGAAVPQRRFEVRDSIELSEFVRPELKYGQPLPPVSLSPDGAKFVVVTRQGSVETGKREATLWLFNGDEVRAAIRRPMAGEFGKARKLVQVASSSNREPLITWSWSSDSRSVLFLESDDDDTRRLYRVDLKGGEIKLLSRPEQDVSRFEERAGVVVYLAHARTTREMLYQAGGPALPDIVAGSGQSVMSMLFPSAIEHFFRSGNDELWMVQNDEARAVLREDRLRPIVLEDSQLSLSPDARRLLVTTAVKHIPKPWENYRPYLDFPGLRLIASTDNAAVTKDGPQPQQYALIELSSGRMAPLVDAPIEYTRSEATVTAAWTEDGSKVAVVGSFAPLDATGKPIGGATYTHCVVAVVEVKARTFSCLQSAQPVDARGSMKNFLAGRQQALTQLRWQGHDQQIVAQFATRDEPDGKTTTTFRLVGKTWTAGEPVAVEVQPDTLTVDIDEALDVPPTLTARIGSGDAHRILDPNPQLKEIALGTAELYHWRDAEGNEWTGGLVKPPQYDARRRYPLVIQTHGLDRAKFLVDGPSATGFAARALAARDIVVLQVDEALTGMNTDKEFKNGAAGYQAAIQQLARDGIIDRAKVGIIAWSHMGPYLLQGMIDEPGAYVAGTLAEASYYSYGEYLMNVDYRGLEEFNAQFGAKPFGDGLKNWLERSPGFNTERICSPLLFQFNSPLALIYGWDVYALMRAQDKPVDLLYLRNGDHQLAQPRQRLAEQGMNVDWYDYWLNDRKDSDPAKAQQYQRWDAMRSKRRCP